MTTRLSLSDYFQDCVDRLATATLASPTPLARLLFAAYTPYSYAMIPHGILAGSTVTPEVHKNIEAAMTKLITKHMPVQYILGEAAFRYLYLKVTSDVLIPRPETEQLVSIVMKHAKDTHKILDLCTGSGAIAISLTMEVHAHVWASDISTAALEVAQFNAQKYHVRIRWIHSDLFSEIPATEKFDIIVSNPPYISKADFAQLPDDVRKHEPSIALTDKSDGLTLIRRVIEESPARLRPGGKLFLEIGESQGAAVRDLLRKTGYTNVEIIKDHTERIRFAMAQFPGLPA